MANDLNKLNDALFDTLDKVRNGEMEPAQAQTVVNIGNTIVNGAKVQLAAFKLTKGQTGISMLGKNEDPSLTIGVRDNAKRYDKAQEYAKLLEYKNVPEAIADLGKDKFNRGVDRFIEDGSVL